MAHKLRVLVVDDDTLVAHSIKKALERGGYGVSIHYSGFGLADAIKMAKPDVIVLDLEMPGLSGDAAVRAIQSVGTLEQIPPIIVLSARADAPRRATAIGAAACLDKPVDLARLLDALERASGPDPLLDDSTCADETARRRPAGRGA